MSGRAFSLARCVPPLPSKPITSIQLFNWLWMQAYEYLHEARELIIVGYSLPAADQMADSLFGSFVTTRLEGVVVVDPHTAALDRWRQVLRGLACQVSGGPTTKRCRISLSEKPLPPEQLLPIRPLWPINGVGAWLLI